MSIDTVLSALLDYYSDKASAEASAVVATTFGLFVILTTKDHRPWIFGIYWFLWLAGLYFLMGFGYWTSHANKTKYILTKQKALPDKDIVTQIEDGVKLEWKKTFLRNCYYLIKCREKLDYRKWFWEHEKKFGITLGDVLHTVFFLFGLSLSCIFFYEQTCALYFVFPIISMAIFVADLFSIYRHRYIWSARREMVASEKGQ
jgi:hypothetical protein